MSFNSHTSLVNTRRFDIVRASSRTKEVRRNGSPHAFREGAFIGACVHCHLVITQECDPETMQMHEPSAVIHWYEERVDGEIDRNIEVGCAIGQSALARLITVFRSEDATMMLDAVTDPLFVFALSGYCGYGDDKREAMEGYRQCAEKWRAQNPDKIARCREIRAHDGVSPVMRGADGTNPDDYSSDADRKFVRDNDLSDEPRSAND